MWAIRGGSQISSATHCTARDQIRPNDRRASPILPTWGTRRIGYERGFLFARSMCATSAGADFCLVFLTCSMEQRVTARCAGASWVEREKRYSRIGSASIWLPHSLAPIKVPVTEIITRCVIDHGATSVSHTPRRVSSVEVTELSTNKQHSLSLHQD
jgi:hypothetical protein